MENPALSLAQDNSVLINQHPRQLAMLIDQDNSFIRNLVCSFLEDDEDMFAAVIAPHEDRPQLARRVVSFLSAYMRIIDMKDMEHSVMTHIEQCLRNCQHRRAGNF
jgi:hypothetical protein